MFEVTTAAGCKTIVETEEQAIAYRKVLLENNIYSMHMEISDPKE